MLRVGLDEVHMYRQVRYKIYVGLNVYGKKARKASSKRETQVRCEAKKVQEAAEKAR